MTDKRITGAANEHALLQLLYRFGWLTTRMLAALQWPDASQGDAMARRTLRRLLAEKLVLKRKAEGTDVWVLATGGARVLREEYDLDATSGQTLKLAHSQHRACANWYLIRKLVTGYGIWTEHEIQTGRAPWGFLEGKAADGLVDPGNEQGLIWVEVENTWKNRARRQDIERLCRRHLGYDNGRMTPLNGGHHLARMAVVSTNLSALRTMLMTFKEAYQAGHLRDAQLSNVEFSLLPVSESLAPGEGWTRDLWADILLIESEV